MAAPKFQEISLSNLLLDNENPRHDPIDNEPEIIAQLMRKERVLELAREIAKVKSTSPLENIGVLPHAELPGKFVVAEGNRRVCALKLLKDPEKAPTPELKRTFAALKRQAGRMPDKVHVVKLKDEDEANYWKGLRHLGAQDGIGVRAWGSTEKTRHVIRTKGGAKSPNELANKLLDYAEAEDLITSEERERIALTTLTRYLNNKLVRDAIGLASTRDVVMNAPADEFNHAVQTFLHDAVPVKGELAPVNSRSNGTQRDAYANELRKKGHATKTRLPEPVTPRAAAAAAKASKRARHNRGPERRPKVVPADFRHTIRSAILKRIFDELREIDPDDYSFAAAYLFRAFLEQLIHQYATDHGVGIEGELHKVIGRVVSHLEKNGVTSEKVLGPLREMTTSENSRISPKTLGRWVHGSSVPTAAEIKARWDSLQAAFQTLLERLK